MRLDSNIESKSKSLNNTYLNIIEIFDDFDLMLLQKLGNKQ